LPVGRLDVDVRMTPEQRRTRLLDEVRLGLFSSPKVISPVWFYDERGSTLFDQITRLPEYYLTRAERALLEANAAEIAAVTRADTLVELGSGTSEKTRLLLDAMSSSGMLRRYAPVDVSEETLRESAETIAAEYPGVEVQAIVGDFHLHLDALPSSRRRLVAFLGSTIGNLTPSDRARFFFDLNCVLTHDDWLLLGVDLVKDPDVLIAAYNDSAGVTAAFNRNALCVLNTELRGHFDPDLFEHEAIWDDGNKWIEMRLRSTVDQSVPIDALEAVVRFDAGEAIRTEISAKFTQDLIEGELYQAGFVTERVWDGNGQFLLVLSRPYC
jgi:L-histidine N-alpha-methyltransferase